MITTGFERNQSFGFTLCRKWRIWPFAVVCFGLFSDILIAQNANQESLSQQIQKLTEAMANTQTQLEQSQRQLVEMQKQLKELQQQVARGSSPQPAPVL